jgi:hypothetical protein
MEKKTEKESGPRSKDLGRDAAQGQKPEDKILLREIYATRVKEHMGGGICKYR